MKKVIYILSILILFQSCYSYKTVDFKGQELKSNMKVKIKLVSGNIIKGKLKEITKTDLVLKNKTIKIYKVEELKTKRLSKTKNSIIGAILSTAILLFLAKLIINSIKVDVNVGNPLKDII